MAGDWIKMRTDLYRDPKVCMIADTLMRPEGELASYVSQNAQRDMTVTRNVMRNVTVGALVTVWGVLRQRGKRVNDDLVVNGCSVHVIDDISDLPGFGFAMESVGWISEIDDNLVLYNFFEDYNVDPAEKLKKQNAERQRRYREKQKEKDNVTSDVTVTHRVEKSREEKSIKESKPKKTSSRKKVKTSMPNNFGISERVKAWAKKNKHSHLEQHLESFRLKCTAKNYQYVNWDSAFMNAIRDNWAKIGDMFQGQSQDRPQRKEL